MLPKIKHLGLTLNEFITGAMVIELARCMRNLRSLQIRSDEKDSNSSRLDFYIVVVSLTRELPDIKQLNIADDRGKRLENTSFLQHIGSNVKKFNKKPQDFKINGKTLKSLIENAAKK